MQDSSRRADHNAYVRGPLEPIDWCKVERAMAHARVLRATHGWELFAAIFRAAWRLRGRGGNRVPGPARAAIALAVLAVTALLAQPPRAFAQETGKMTASVDRDDIGDQSLLAAFGLPADAIERCQDAELLWRVVRELVLTQRVSEPMQQRILRRAWLADPAVREGSFTDSAAN